MSELKKKLFKLFTENKQNYYGLYLEVENLITSEVHKARAEENVEFYDCLRQLNNSINNAGCEERRSEQIDLIRQAQEVIITKYENYLP